VQPDFLFSCPPSAAVGAAFAALGAGVGVLDFQRPLAAARALYTLLRTQDRPLVHFHFVNGHHPLVAAAQLADATVVLHDHAVHDEHQLPRGARAAAFWIGARTVARRIDLRIAVSHAVAESLVRADKTPHAQLAVVHNGVDLTRFRPDAALRRSVRAELRLGDGAVVLYVGRLIAAKGPELLVRAAAGAEVGSALRRATLLFVGEGPRREELEAIARALGVGAKLRLLGLRDDVHRFHAAADVVVVPSRVPESFCLVAAEAMGAGVPVVASAVGAVPEVVQHGMSGLLVPAGSADALRAGLCRILDDAALRAHMGCDGRRIAEARFGLPRWSSELFRVLDAKLGAAVAAPATAARGS